MKAMEYLCRSIWGLIILLCLPIAVSSQATKSLTDTLDMQDITRLSITNQYGDIVISTWDRDQIGYSVQIAVLKDDISAAHDLLDRLVYSVEEFNAQLTFDYEVESLNAGFFERLWSDITLEIDQSGIQIDVELTVPRELSLDIENKFGDITIRDWNGSLKVKQKHGNVRVSGNVKDLRLEQSFGDADFNTIESARIEIRNVEFDAKNIDEFIIESHGSVININNTLQVTIDSNKDDLTIDRVNQIKGSVYYGSLYIDELVDKIQAQLKLTDLKIKNIISEDAVLSIDQTNSDVDIDLNGQAMDLEATLQDGLLNVPKSSSELSTIILDKKDEKRSITGNIGSNPKGKIVLNGKKGIIIIR